MCLFNDECVYIQYIYHLMCIEYIMICVYLMITFYKVLSFSKMFIGFGVLQLCMWVLCHYISYLGWMDDKFFLIYCS